MRIKQGHDVIMFPFSTREYNCLYALDGTPCERTQRKPHPGPKPWSNYTIVHLCNVKDGASANEHHTWAFAATDAMTDFTVQQRERGIRL